jgi:hypothetical protein
MSFIEIKKAVRDTESLRDKIVDFMAQDKFPSIVQLSAASQVCSAMLVQHYFESEKCLETLMSIMFSSMKADILLAVEGINSKVK